MPAGAQPDPRPTAQFGEHWAAAIDWSRPWLEPYRAHGEAVALAAANGLALHEALNNAAGDAPIHFVAPQVQPREQPYESYIASTGCCPTRDNLHDFFNGLAWLHWPRAKQRLADLQARELAARGSAGQRGALRDALTLFDENGAVLMAPRDMWESLVAHEWKSLFITQRKQWSGARLVLFGHALLEKLITPRKAITAHVIAVPDAPDSIADMDAWLADTMTHRSFAAKPFAPLPVLGVPLWCSGNETETFYDDPLVFRPRKTRITTDNSAQDSKS
jgi:hypothetical protein